MDSTEKTVLIVGGLGLGAVLLFSFFKQAQLNALAAANQPGLNYQPSMPSYSDTGVLGSVLNGISIGSSALGSIFASLPNFGGSNDPGLESGEDDIAYSGNDYTYANSNSYGDGGYPALSTDSSDSTDYGVLFED